MHRSPENRQETRTFHQLLTYIKFRSTFYRQTLKVSIFSIFFLLSWFYYIDYISIFITYDYLLISCIDWAKIIGVRITQHCKYTVNCLKREIILDKNTRTTSTRYCEKKTYCKNKGEKQILQKKLHRVWGGCIKFSVSLWSRLTRDNYFMELRWNDLKFVKFANYKYMIKNAQDA